MLPTALEQNPNLSNWVSIEGDTIVVHTGKVELGQGIRTAIAIIAAEELEVAVDRIRVKTGNTAVGPNEFLTAGSMSIEGSGSAVRQACAEVRHHLLKLAAARFHASVDELVVDEGIIKHSGTNSAISYAEILGGKSLDVQATGNVASKDSRHYRFVGRTTTRVDLMAKLTGQLAYVQDLRDDQTLHGRIVRPPGLAYTLKHIDTKNVELMREVRQVVVDGSFIGVVANSEWAASQAKAKLEKSARWVPDETKRLPLDIYHELVASSSGGLLVEQGTPTLSPIPDRRSSGQTLKAIYKKPYHLHGSIGPSAATARWQDDKLYIRSHSQGPFVIRGALAVALDVPVDNIVVQHVENAGCYGHNGADDAAMDAAMLARAVPGETVLLKWERQDEHAWEPFSPAMVMDMQASLDQGYVSHWNADIYSQTHSGRPVPHRSFSNLIAAWHKSNPIARPEARPGMGNHSGIHRNADPYYNFARRRIVKHLVKDDRIRTSSTRGLGAYGNIFAIESFMDELAHAAGIDPVAFRLDQLVDPRAKAVIARASELASLYVEQDQFSVDKGWRQGRGLAFARYKNRQTYTAVVIFLIVNEETFEIRLDHGIIVADAGQVIDCDGLANQLEGGLIQSASWTLKEQVQFDEWSSVSRDWDTYPILRFSEVPTVEVCLLDHPELPSMGAGEATQGPTPAAIANALFDAVGIRLREIPFTPDRLRAAALQD